MSRSRETEGFSSLLVVALVILAGLLFAAGVMVGRNLAPTCLEKANEAATTAEAPPALSFPRALEGENHQLPQPPVAARAADNAASASGQRKKPPATTPGKRVEQAHADRVTGREKAAAGSFCLQVAAYRQIEPAQQLIAKLQAKGFSQVKLVKSDVPGKGTYFRVRLGSFSNRQQAQRLQQRLAVEEAMDSLVVREGEK